MHYDETEKQFTEKSIVSRIRRRRLFVDAKLQGALLAHATIYWFYCLLSISLIAFCWIIFTTRPSTSAGLFGQLWVNFGPALLGSLLLLPIVLIDCLRLSNRFAGPMVRIRKAMKQLADGEAVPAIKLREGDFWREFADDLNRAAARLREPQRGAERPRNSSAHVPVSPDGKEIYESAV